MGKDNFISARKKPKAAQTLETLKETLLTLRSQPYVDEKSMRKIRWAFRYMTRIDLLDAEELADPKRYQTAYAEILRLLGTTQEELKKLFGCDVLAFSPPKGFGLIEAY